MSMTTTVTDSATAAVSTRFQPLVMNCTSVTPGFASRTSEASCVEST